MDNFTNMSKQEIINILEGYTALQKSAQKIAVRWVRAQDKGYYQATMVNICPEEDKVKFVAQPVTSGVGLSASFPIRFLWDDTGLEEAAKEQWRVYQETRDALCKERDEINKLNTRIRLMEIQNQLNSSTLDNPAGSQIQLPHFGCLNLDTSFIPHPAPFHYYGT